ncbi:hypothetical protein HTZ77_32575 [Nonomuraea sp. SMC257]|uniref:Uncharacterized protein n=1 Tax=Nonomuraea montanisoli TaxID=2741721 RepID=A0A7Y6ID77_9ACTN|nr:hypothetical protein [Nonomuraea montanisoli]NUW36117.1 hypothetical protein [Nonomuraea montanisoli]
MEVESSICLSDLVPALRWSRPQQVAEALGDPRLPAAWWSSVSLSRALATAGLDWICERVARLAAARWDHLPLSDLLPALSVHRVDPALPGWSDATRTAVAGLGGWQRLRRLSPADLATPSATPEVVINSVLREVLGRIQHELTQTGATAAVQAGQPEVTRPFVPRPAGASGEGAAASSGPFPAQPAAHQTGSFPAQPQSGAFPAQGEPQSGGFAAQRQAAAQQSGGFPAQGEGVPPHQTGGFPAVGPEPHQTGGFPTVGPEPHQTGGFPTVGPEPHQTGGFPAVGPEPHQTGGFPAVGPEPQQTGGTPQRDTGAFPGQPGSDTGSFPRPGAAGPQDTGALPARPGASNDTGAFARPGTAGRQDTGALPTRPGAAPTGPLPRTDAPAPNGQAPGATQPGQPAQPGQPGQPGPQVNGQRPAVPVSSPLMGDYTGAPASPAPSPVPSDMDHAMVRVVDSLFRGLDKLELAVAVHRLFAEDPVSLRTLAHKMLVDRDQLSHAQRTAEERVLHWLRSSESAPVTGHMFRLTEWLGAAATQEQLIGADPAHPVIVPSLRTPLWRVLVTLMPDRRLQDGWLVVGDIQRLQARTRQLLASQPADADVVELLGELGIRAHSAKAWLEALPPESSAQDAAAAPSPAQPLPRRTPGANGHHHRGGQPIPAAGAGSIDPSAALATLSALSGGRSPMLPSLAGAPSTPPPPIPGPSSEPRRWQRIEVTPEHLRGGPVPVPEGYAAQLGMRPGTLLSVTGPGDNAIVLVWQGHQPVFDSLQPVLMRLNARPGDQVYVTVDGYRLEAQLTG